jgi:hypothetical protein
VTTHPLQAGDQVLILDITAGQQVRPVDARAYFPKENQSPGFDPLCAWLAQDTVSARQHRKGAQRQQSHNDEGWPEKANAVKERILHNPERARRIDEKIKMYLTREYGYLEFLQPWAARRLRRESWG